MALEPAPVRIDSLREDLLGEFQSLRDRYFEEMNILPEWTGLDRDAAEPLLAYTPPRAGFWLARDHDGRAVGMAGLRTIANRTSELKRIFVLPEARRMGYGQALLNQVLNFARLADYLEVLLAIRPDQKGALTLCERNGFKPCARYNQDRRAGIFLSYRFALNL